MYHLLHYYTNKKLLILYITIFIWWHLLSIMSWYSEQCLTRYESHSVWRTDWNKNCPKSVSIKQQKMKCIKQIQYLYWQRKKKWKFKVWMKETYFNKALIRYCPFLKRQNYKQKLKWYFCGGGGGGEYCIVSTIIVHFKNTIQTILTFRTNVIRVTRVSTHQIHVHCIITSEWNDDDFYSCKCYLCWISINCYFIEFI